MNNTTNNTKEIDNVLKNEWIFTILDNEIIGRHVEISCPNEHLKVAEIPYIDDTAKENAAHIVSSYNNTIAKNINPESVPLMLEALNCIKKNIELIGRNAGTEIDKTNWEICEEAINKATL